MRPASNQTTEALAAEHVPYLVFVELDFVGGAVRLTNAAYDFEWNGYTWVGCGNLGAISEIEEGQDLQMYGCMLSLSGLSADYVAKCFGAEYSGRDATIWLAPLDDDYRVIADPIIIFRGRMDTMPIKLGAESVISLTVESELTDWERPRIRRYNNEDQQSEYPDDRGFEYVPQMVEKQIFWGRPS